MRTGEESEPCVTLATVLAPVWTELTSWLAANAPRMYECLRPAGDPGRILSAEEQLGFALGAELTEWWHLHDGVTHGNIVPGYELLGVDGMLNRHQTQLDVNFEEEVNEMARRNLGLADDEAGGPARYFPAELIPIGDDGAGNYLVVDCRPGPERGCLRDHDHEDRGVIQPPMFDSLTDLVTRVVTSLRTGQPLEIRTPAGTLRRTPTVSDGMVWWNSTT